MCGYGGVGVWVWRRGCEGVSWVVWLWRGCGGYRGGVVVIEGMEVWLWRVGVVVWRRGCGGVGMEAW